MSAELSIPAPHDAPFTNVCPNPKEDQMHAQSAEMAEQHPEVRSEDVESGSQTFGGVECAAGGNTNGNRDVHQSVGGDSTSNGGGVSSGTSQYFTRPPSTRGLNNPTLKKAWNTTYAGLYKTYLVCDKIGEKIADFLGITDSRFQYAVDEYNRMQEKKAEDARREAQIATRRAQTVEQGECDGPREVTAAATSRASQEEPQGISKSMSV